MFGKKSKSRTLWVFPLLFLGAWLVYGERIFKGVWGPILGPGDTDTNPNLGFLFSRMVSFFPWPHLSFFTDYIFYPFGILSAFQTWCFERDLLAVVFPGFFETGPLLPLYAALSVGITGIGTFLLLRSSFGPQKAWLAAFGTAFFGFYAFHKYPGHLNIAVCHWTVLNVLADFVLYRQWYRDGKIPLRWLQARLLLLLLCLGTDLSYSAGFALASFSVTFVFTAFGIWSGKKFHALLSGWKKDFRASPWLSSFLALASLFLFWLYVPLCVQLFFEVRAIPLGYSGSYWANPLRWLLPWFPFLNPLNAGVDPLLGDRPEGLGAASPGWTLLLLGGLGAWRVWKKRDGAYFPLLVFIGLCVLHHPQIFPVLKVFPWFSLMRVAGRSTLVFPVFLILLALEIQPSAVWKRLLGVGVGILACLELYTAYFQLSVEPRVSVGEDFWIYQRAVQNSEGAAVLDWPFCILSGNGVTDALCPYHQLLGDFALQRFHHKKVMGLNMGRLTPELAAPYLKSGWRFLFAPHSSHASQSRCFNDAEWKFFDTFYTLGDFAGIQLHAGLLPPECVMEFHKRYGDPSAVVYLPSSGPAEFIPKDLARSVKQDLTAAKALRYEPSLKQAVDLVAEETPYGIILEGFQIGLAPKVPRAAEAQEVSIEFFLNGACGVELDARLQTVFTDQAVELFLNETKLGEYAFQEASLDVKLVAQGKEGQNQLKWKFAKKGNWADIAKAWSERSGSFKSLRLFARENRNRPARFEVLKIIPGLDCP